MNCLTARQTLELAQSDPAQSGPALSGPALSGPALSGPALSGPALSDPAPSDRASSNRARPGESADVAPVPEHCAPYDFAPYDFDPTLVDEASRHVEGCPICRTALRRQEEFDKTLGGMIRDVAVPGDLKERLLACLKPVSHESAAAGGPSEAPRAIPSETISAGGIPAAAATANRATPLPVRSGVGSRRRWLGAISLAAAVCVFAGISVITFWPRAETVSLEEIGAFLARTDIRADHLPEFTQFAGGLTPQVPATMRTERLGTHARRLGNQDVAVYFFTLRGPNKTTLEGRLAVIPIRLVPASQLPPATSFLGGPTPTYKGGFCITAWVEGGFVYVCCLEGAEDELHRLLPKQHLT